MNFYTVLDSVAYLLGEMGQATDPGIATVLVKARTRSPQAGV